ncbi:hypothetical protein ACIBG5_31760 [Kribbella sp. NPDC050241]|uniref:hypothetical protein n=1 Tax=Kribbella sp. NPDC050241 TaxID=3364115 RepID=UPI00379B6E0C
MKRIALFAGTAVLGLSALTACSNGSSAGSPAPQSTPAASAPASNAPAKVSTATAGNFGKIVVDGTGRTLYVYDLDTAKPSKSNCYTGCAALWPPFLAGTGKPQVSGVDPSLVGTVARTDGTKQVTLAGWPLYHFANDSKAGDVNGQGVDGTWWVDATNGQKITTQASSSGGNAGY